MIAGTQGRQKGFTLIETAISLAVFLIILATAFTSITNMLTLSTASDWDMLVVTENQRGLRSIKYDLYSSSCNPHDSYHPRIVDGELRFCVVTGFNTITEKPIYSYWDNFQVCYWYDEENHLLVRRFRDNTGQLLDEAPAQYPGPAAQTVSAYCTGFEFPEPINVNAGCLVTIKLTNSIGKEEDPRYATITNEISVMPGKPEE